jgi:membrane carboxypeptidase/penicillin-binding protein
MAFTGNRASRRRAYFIEDTLDGLRKVAVRLAVLLVVLGILFGVGIYFAKKTTPVALAKMRSESLTMRVSDLTGEQLAELLLSCDPDFYTHSGYSFHSPGFRTITQRLVEHYYFKQYQPWLEMPPGTMDAHELNRKMPKDEQLLVFLNTTPFGTSREHDVHGFQEAAQYFFDKKFRDLNRDEYISILAMLADPEKYHIQGEALANIERANRLKRMLDGKCKATSLLDVELKNCK